MTDHSLAAEGPADHIRNALQLLADNETDNKETRSLMSLPQLYVYADLYKRVGAAKSRLQKALAQLEGKP